MRKNKIIDGDLQYIYDQLSQDERKKFKDSTVLITGCAGFLGYYFLLFLSRFSSVLGIKKIIGLDNFLVSSPDWINELVKESDCLSLHKFDIIVDDISDISAAEEATIVIHLASVASPPFYRKYPIETIDANVTGLRKLIEFYKDKSLRSCLFFSSSEIYGDPFPEYIPTKESYRGNVATMGPRACYDEAKRFGETLCYIFHHEYNIPITIARPFNNFGPGMNLHDKRLPSDLAKSVFDNEDIILFSDGQATRTFCYISDAILGYLKVLLYDQFDVFNIGQDQPEMPVKEFANLFCKGAKGIFNYDISIQRQTSEDQKYLTDNPNRRCPDITKAKSLLNYCPSISVEDGINRYLEFIKIYDGKLL
ncbi:epimerase [Candidatus Marinamargulisbacteria bacterium SCGC AG-439-L15]|nr:epimerase [Candidatus Marinamargulisbacteria bacterium SCGC AG-439-L15]